MFRIKKKSFYNVGLLNDGFHILFTSMNFIDKASKIPIFTYVIKIGDMFLFY